MADAKLLASGIGGVVWEVRSIDGTPLIVKEVSALAQAEAHQATAFLDWRDGHGAVRLLDARSNLQLLEYAGTISLVEVLQSGGDAAATAVAVDVLRRLHAPSPLPAPRELQSLRERFAALFRLATRGAPADVAAMIGEGARLAHDLLGRQEKLCPLHGDVHHGNILAGPRGWLAIDPHGLFGDPGYDAANLFYNPAERQDLRTSPARAAAMAAQLSEALGRGPGEFLRWACAHACLSASWHLEDGNDGEARASLGVADAVRRALAMHP